MRHWTISRELHLRNEAGMAPIIIAMVLTGIIGLAITAAAIKTNAILQENQVSAGRERQAESNTSALSYAQALVNYTGMGAGTLQYYSNPGTYYSPDPTTTNILPVLYPDPYYDPANDYAGPAQLVPLTSTNGRGFWSYSGNSLRVSIPGGGLLTPSAFSNLVSSGSFPSSWSSSAGNSTTTYTSSFTPTGVHMDATNSFAESMTFSLSATAKGNSWAYKSSGKVAVPPPAHPICKLAVQGLGSTHNVGPNTGVTVQAYVTGVASTLHFPTAGFQLQYYTQNMQCAQGSTGCSWKTNLDSQVPDGISQAGTVGTPQPLSTVSIRNKANSIRNVTPVLAYTFTVLTPRILAAVDNSSTYVQYWVPAYVDAADGTPVECTPDYVNVVNAPSCRISADNYMISSPLHPTDPRPALPQLSCNTQSVQDQAATGNTSGYTGNILSCFPTFTMAPQNVVQPWTVAATTTQVPPPASPTPAAAAAAPTPSFDGGPSGVATAASTTASAPAPSCSAPSPSSSGTDIVLNNSNSNGSSNGNGNAGSPAAPAPAPAPTTVTTAAQTFLGNPYGLPFCTALGYQLLGPYDPSTFQIKVLDPQQNDVTSSVLVTQNGALAICPPFGFQGQYTVTGTIGSSISGSSNCVSEIDVSDGPGQTGGLAYDSVTQKTVPTVQNCPLFFGNGKNMAPQCQGVSSYIDATLIDGGAGMDYWNFCASMGNQGMNGDPAFETIGYADSPNDVFLCPDGARCFGVPPCPTCQRNLFVVVSDASSASCQAVGQNRISLGCFNIHTKIRMGDGLTEKEIGHVKAGDEVWNPATKKAATVKWVSAGFEAKPLVRLTLDDGSQVRVTVQHPIPTKTGLKQAIDVLAGEFVQNGKGEWHQLTEAIVESKPSKEMVLNLKINPTSADPMDHMLEANGVQTGDLYLQEKLADKSQKLSRLP